MDRIRSKGCQVKCNFLWDGYGRWVRNIWKPHFKGTRKYELIVASIRCSVRDFVKPVERGNNNQQIR